MAGRAPRLDIPVGVSPRLLIFGGVLHGLVLVVLLFGPLAWLGLPVFGNCLAFFWRHGLWLQRHRVLLRVDPGETWLQVDQRWFPVQLSGESLVWRRIALLRMRIDGTRWPRALVLTPDCVDADQLRRLRVMARLGALARS